jgi:hypothetical protein
MGTRIVKVLINIAKTMAVSSVQSLDYFKESLEKDEGKVMTD